MRSSASSALIGWPVGAVFIPIGSASQLLRTRLFARSTYERRDGELFPIVFGIVVVHCRWSSQCRFVCFAGLASALFMGVCVGIGISGCKMIDELGCGIYQRVRRIKRCAEEAIVLCQSTGIPARSVDYDQLWLIFKLEQAWAYIAKLDEPFSDQLAAVRQEVEVAERQCTS